MTSIRTIAVLDDNDADLELTVMAVEAAGFKPLPLHPRSSIEETFAEIRASAQALVSDHNLTWGQHASFNGAELVDRCYHARFPAVLVTGYIIDSTSSIREFRRGVPELISRSDLDGERLLEALERTEGELADRPPHDRIPRTSLVRIDRVDSRSGQIDVVVPQWDPLVKVSMPRSLLDPGLRNSHDLVGKRLFGQVNTGAERQEDLFFDGLHDAGEVPPDEEFDD